MGNCGQMLSPLHVCLIVTGEYFATPLAELWKDLWKPVTCQFLIGAGWATILWCIGANF
jgi:hypothetical protein